MPSYLRRLKETVSKRRRRRRLHLVEPPERFRSLWVERFEERILLSAAPTVGLYDDYVPARHHLFEPTSYLTAPSDQAPLAIAREYLVSQAGAWNYSAEDFSTATVIDQYTSASTGLTYLSLRQSFAGLEIANAQINVQVTAAGQVLSVAGGFVPELNRSGADPTPLLDPLTAATTLYAVAEDLGLPQHSTPALAAGPYRPESALVLVSASLSRESIPARLQYVATPEGLRTSWNYSLTAPDGQYAYELSVDGADAAPLLVRDLYRSPLEDWLAGSPAPTAPATLSAGSSPYFYFVDERAIALEPIADQFLIGFNEAFSGDLSDRVPSVYLPAIDWTASNQLDSQTAVIHAAGASVARDLAAALAVVDGKSWVGPRFRDPLTGATLLPNNEIIVALQEGVDPDELFVGALSNYRPLRGTPDQFIVSLDVATTFETLGLANALHDDPRTAWATPEFYFEVELNAMPDDPQFSDQWHLQNTGQHAAKPGADANMLEAWDVETGSTTPIVIAVLDDGVQLDHPDLNIYTNEGEIPGNGEDDDGNGYVDDVHGWDFHNDDNDAGPLVASDNHGTAVAGVAAARGNNGVGVTGASWDAQILPVKIFRDDPGGLGSGIAKNAEVASAVYYAAGRTKNGIGTWKAADILNNSWGGGASSQAVIDAFAWAESSGRQGKGAVSVAAAGNDASGYIRTFPLGIPAGTWEFEWRYTKSASGSGGSDTAWLANVHLPDGTIERFDTSTLPSGWTSSGASAWSIVDDPAHAYGTGRYQAKAGAISDGQTTTLRTGAITVTGTGKNISYHAWVSSETSDQLSLWVRSVGAAEFQGPFRSMSGDPTVTTDVAYPASLSSTIAVGASTDWDYRADYSQYGTSLDVLAPSSGGFTRITTTDRTGDDGYIGGGLNYTSTFGGTSSAAPLVSGIVALMLSRNPTLTATEVRDNLRASAEKVGGVTYVDGFHLQYGYGRVDAKSALDLVAAVPEIDVQGNGLSIKTGDLTPGTADHTDFGSAVLTHGTVTRTFTIVNTGSGELNLTGPVPNLVQISGTHAADFSVTAQPSSPLDALTGTTTFSISFTASDADLRQAFVTIANNDVDEVSYVFGIQGTGTQNAEAEIEVRGNSVVIVSGDTIPSPADHTDFGSVNVTGATASRTFVIANHGSAALDLTGTPRVQLSGTHPGDFSVTTQPSTPVAAGGSTTSFIVQFDPTAIGTREATVTIANNDGDEGTFQFVVNGFGESLDFGDAPAPYRTTLAENGPRHQATGPTLGTLRDAEVDGTHSADADSDDATGADEDGIAFGDSMFVGQLGATATVNVQNAPAGAKLDAWVDFNRDGTFNGVQEQIAAKKVVVNGDNVITFAVPSWAVAGVTFTRFRVSTAGGLSPLGSAPNGEVEDHVLTIGPPLPASGFFLEGQNVSTAASGAAFVTAVDLDQDGDMDLLSANATSNNISWYRNDGNQGFTNLPVSSLVSAVATLAVADLDRDGDLDIVAGSNASGLCDSLYWFRNDGLQSFTRLTIPSTSNGGDCLLGVAGLQVTDIDNDGDLDIVTTSRDNTIASGELLLSENLGNQVFQTRLLSNAAPYATGLSAADVDGDGDLDLIVSSFADDDTADGSSSDGMISWLENVGINGFLPRTVDVDAPGATAVFAADVDSDGDMDLLGASSITDQVAWYENSGSQIFSERVITSAADNVQSIFAADIDGDGDIDVVSASQEDGKVAWYRNDGSETFTAATIAANAAGAKSVFVADIDRDGVLDVVSASADDNKIAWYKQIGLDFGDAPASYPTTLAENGARHADRGPQLGLHRDIETGAHSTSADGDDADGLDDEDGVTFATATLVATSLAARTGQVQVDLRNPDAASNRLDAWIDWNRDGDWADAGEQILTNHDLGQVAVIKTIDFDIPQKSESNVVAGQSFARFRLSTAGGLSVTGSADDGEVEDHAVTIAIDDSQPSVSDVSVNDLQLSDTDVGSGKFSVTVTFTEPMRTDTPPDLVFNPDVAGGAAPSLSNGSGVWSTTTNNNDTYTVTFDVADRNVAIADITIDVAGAKDAVGNPQQDYAPAIEFSIDTLAPTVSSVSVNDALLTDANVGADKFIATVNFSEEMNTSVAPAFTFTPDVAGGATPTLTNGSGVWTDDDTYTMTYDVSDHDLTLDGVTIDVSGASDAAGNPQSDYTPLAQFSIDTFNPAVVGVSVNDALLTDADAGTDKFIVTVNFSEAMSTAAPLLTFPSGVADGGTATLTNGSGVWTDSDSYTATYDVSDHNLTLADVTIDISGASDEAGNPQQDYSPEPEFGIDTLNPAVVTVSVNDALLTDADAGTDKFVVTVNFSEAMSTAVAPTLTFAPDVAAGGTATLSNGTGVWSTTTNNNDTYTVTYDVSDQDLTQTNVTIDVSGASDAAGNPQQDYAPVAEFSIDTLNLAVSGVSVNDPVLTDADVGTDRFVVTVSFNEAMDAGAVPVLTFAPNVAGVETPTLANGSGIWSTTIHANDTYTVTYDVLDQNVTFIDVTIDVTGTLGASGNPQQDYTPVAEFSIDTLNPVVTGVSVNNSLLTDADAGVDKFIVTVNFSEAMNTSVTPALRFTPDVAGGATPTLANDSGVWTDSDTYTMTYDVLDQNLTHSSITIDVTGALDAAGNPQQDYTPLAEFSIDTLNPAVTGVSVNDALLTDADAGNDKFVVTVNFGEAMNTGTAPILVFAPEVADGGAATLSSGTGVWTDSDTYTMTYDVLDQNLTQADISIDVSGAIDASGNPQQDYTPVAEFSIDTLAPVVSSVSVNDAVLTVADVGADKFIVTVNFSEAMNTGTAPTLGFPSGVADGGVATLANGSGVWTDSDTYTMTYDVLDQNLTHASIEIDVSGASDASGNPQQDYTPEPEFSIDTLDPVVSGVTVNDTLLADADAGTDKFIVTVNFSEAMNTGTAPILGFPSGVADGGTATLINGTGVWTDNDTYTMTYDVSDQNLTLDGITIDVSGAVDAAGNPQQDYSPVSEFSVDMLNPAVVSVSVNDALLTDADVGTDRFVVTVNFSEAMNTGTAPILGFPSGVADGGTATLANGSGVWTDNDAYTMTYDVADQNLTLTGVTIDVSGASDAAGNPQQDYSPEPEFSIDTLTAAVNSAPLLDTSGSPILTAITEDSLNPAGDAVENIVLNGSITDPDVPTAADFQEGSTSSGGAGYTADAVTIRQWNGSGFTGSANQDGSDEILVGFNEPSGDKTTREKMRGLLEFDLNDLKNDLGAAPHTIENVSLVLRTATTSGNRSGAGTSLAFSIDVYEYGHDIDESTATWAAPASGDGTPGGSHSNLLSSSATFNPVTASQTITIGGTAAFRQAISTALAGDGVLRLLLRAPDAVENPVQTSNFDAAFTRLVAESDATEASRPRLDISLASPKSIALIGADGQNGQWQFSTNEGGSWTALGSPTSETARLLSPAHLIRFVPAADYAGTATFTYRAWDQTTGSAGATAETTTNGGSTAFSTAIETATITVNAVNDAPTFGLGPSFSVNDHAGAQEVTSFLTNASPGPSDEATQTLSLSVTNDNNSLFEVQPTIDLVTGMLSYTPAIGASGLTTVTVTLVDDGGTSNGGVNSTAQTFAIRVVDVGAFVVNTLADTADASPGDGLAVDNNGNVSLRAAIEEANAIVGSNSIEFASSLTTSGPAKITLEGSQLNIAEDIVISGPGSTQLTIDANLLTRVLLVNSGVSADVSGLTLTRGRVVGNGGAVNNAGSLIMTDVTTSDSVANTHEIASIIITHSAGGGIYSSGSLTLIDSKVLNNSVDEVGAGIHSWGPLTILDSTISDNSAAGAGGGIYCESDLDIVNTLITNNNALHGAGINSSGTVAQIEFSTFSGNSASSFGGGLLASAFPNITLVITDSTFTDNHARNGGAIMTGPGETLHLLRSTLANNTASASGGGLFHEQLGTAILVNTTISGNSADTTGGGINNRGTLWMINGTVTGNIADADNDSAEHAGGGIISSGTPETLHNTIVAGNHVDGPSGSGTANDIQGVIEVSSHSLISDASSSGGILNGSDGNRVGTDPLLGPLQNNGGPTPTHALLPGSPAIDAGSNALSVDAQSQPLTTDQRGAGFARVVNGTADIGAVERVNESPTDIGFSNNKIPENAPVGTAVGTLLATDPDLENAHTFTLISGAGDTDNTSFTIVGSEIQSSAVFDFESKSSYSVRVRATDAGGLSFEKTLNIDVTNVAPLVTGLYVRGSGWNASYLNTLAAAGLGSSVAGYRLVDGAAQLANASLINWQTVNQISATFNESVIVDPNALRLLNSNNQDLPLSPTGFTYDVATRTAKWTLASALTRDKFLISLEAAMIEDGAAADLDGEYTTSIDSYASSGNGTAGGDLNFRFNYLPGDVSRSGQTNAGDANLIRSLGTVTPNATNFWRDVTANNQINAGDANYIASLGTLSLTGISEPANPPPPRVASPSLATSLSSYDASAEPIPTASLNSIMMAAIEVRAASGLSGAQEERSRTVPITGSAPDPGSYLSLSNRDGMAIDVDASSLVWSVDVIPGKSEESRRTGPSEIRALSYAAAYDQVDLLTMVMNELAQQLGPSDPYSADRGASLMSSRLPEAARRASPVYTPASQTLKPPTISSAKWSSQVDRVFASPELMRGDKADKPVADEPFTSTLHTHALGRVSLYNRVSKQLRQVPSTAILT